MYQFVLWGYGKRGKRFMRNCPPGHIVSIIDKKWNDKSEETDIPMISYEQYKGMFKDYDIVIAVDDNAEIIQSLERDGIYNYHLLEDCPPEIVGYGKGTWVDKLPVNLKKENTYVLLGLNLYTMLLREFLMKKYGFEGLDIIPEEKNMRSHCFSQKYSFVKERQIQAEETVLWACRKICGFKSQKEIEQIFDFSNVIEDYYNPKLEKFKGICEGEKCFIVATGPSITSGDLDLVKKSGCKSFGVNRIYLAFEQTEWRPDFLVVIDDKIMTTYREEIYACDAKVKFLGDQVGIKRNMENVYRLHDHILEFFPDIPKFSENIERRAYSARTVVYTCIQIACYMGCKEIYLLGTDHNYERKQTDTSNHFHKDYYKGNIKPDSYFKEKAELAYRAAEEYAAAHGIKIYNATRGGKLEVFKRKSLEEILREAGNEEKLG